MWREGGALGDGHILIHWQTSSWQHITSQAVGSNEHTSAFIMSDNTITFILIPSDLQVLNVNSTTVACQQQISTYLVNKLSIRRNAWN
jgi:hypothetical protein